MKRILYLFSIYNIVRLTRNIYVNMHVQIRALVLLRFIDDSEVNIFVLYEAFN